MIEKLTALYNTLMLIETKGENTKLMAQCLAYMNQLIETEKDNKSIHTEEESK